MLDFTWKRKNTLVVMTRKLKSTIKYDPNTRSNSKSNVTLATCNNTFELINRGAIEIKPILILYFPYAIPTNICCSNAQKREMHL